MEVEQALFTSIVTKIGEIYPDDMQAIIHGSQRIVRERQKNLDEDKLPRSLFQIAKDAFNAPHHDAIQNEGHTLTQAEASEVLTQIHQWAKPTWDTAYVNGIPHLYFNARLTEDEMAYLDDFKPPIIRCDADTYDY